MPRELNVISQPGSSSGGDACTYMWACAICDENETCQKDKEGHSRWLVAKRMERIEYKVLVMSNKGGVGKSTCTTNHFATLARMYLYIMNFYAYRYIFEGHCITDFYINFRTCNDRISNIEI